MDEYLYILTEHVDTLLALKPIPPVIMNCNIKIMKKFNVWVSMPKLTLFKKAVFSDFWIVVLFSFFFSSRLCKDFEINLFLAMFESLPLEWHPCYSPTLQSIYLLRETVQWTYDDPSPDPRCYVSHAGPNGCGRNLEDNAHDSQNNLARSGRTGRGNREPRIGYIWLDQSCLGRLFTHVWKIKEARDINKLENLAVKTWIN